MAKITVKFDLFNLIDGAELKLFVADVSKGAWTTRPPQTLRPRERAECECWGPDTGYEVRLVYEPDQFRLLKVTCKPDGIALNAESYASDGYHVVLGPGGVGPNYILGLNYHRG